MEAVTTSIPAITLGVLIALTIMQLRKTPNGNADNTKYVKHLESELATLRTEVVKLNALLNQCYIQLRFHEARLDHGKSDTTIQIGDKIGDGASVAKGDGAKAIGERGVNVDGGVGGSATTGDNNESK